MRERKLNAAVGHKTLLRLQMLSDQMEPNGLADMTSVITPLQAATDWGLGTAGKCHQNGFEKT